MADKIRLRGEDAADAMREWVRDDIKRGPGQRHELGKFCFTVSAGTIGAIAAIEKLNASSSVDFAMALAFGLLFVSTVVGVYLASPRRVEVGGETDLEALHRKEIREVVCTVWAWFGLWLVATVIGGYAVRS